MTLSSAVEVAGAGAPVRANVLMTCEHASKAIPAEWPEGFPEEDKWVVGMHWSIDLGAEDFARELATAVGGRAVIAKFSRLLCDCNRMLDSDTLFRAVADGKKLALNASVSAEEREKRLNLLYHPYHAALDAELDDPTVPPVKLIFSIHSFTDMYEGQKRELEVGVLCKEDDAIAVRMTDDLNARGFVTRVNEPWSGLQGFMYSADMHAQRIGAQPLMIEARQDLLVQPEWRAKLVSAVVDSLAAMGFGAIASK